MGGGLGLIGEVVVLLLNGSFLFVLSGVVDSGIRRGIAAAGGEDLGEGFEADVIEAIIGIDDDAGSLEIALGDDGIVAVIGGRDRHRIDGVGGVDKGIFTRAADADHVRGDVLDIDGQLEGIEDVTEAGLIAIPGIGVAVFRLLGVVAQRELLLPDVGLQIALGAHGTKPCHGLSVDGKGIEQHGQYQYHAQDAAPIGPPEGYPRHAPLFDFIF